MSPTLKKRKIAIKVADALNKIEGVPVSEKAQEISMQWANGEITGEQMKLAILAMHKKV